MKYRVYYTLKHLTGTYSDELHPFDTREQAEVKVKSVSKKVDTLHVWIEEVGN